MENYPRVITQTGEEVVLGGLGASLPTGLAVGDIVTVYDTGTYKDNHCEVTYVIVAYKDKELTKQLNNTELHYVNKVVDISIAEAGHRASELEVDSNAVKIKFDKSDDYKLLAYAGYGTEHN